MKKNFARMILTLVLCCTCALLVTGCEEYDNWETLTVTPETMTCSVYSNDGKESFQEWSNKVFKDVEFTYTNTRITTESFTCKGLEAFRAKGGRLSFDPHSAGEHVATFSYDGASCEITVTVS